MSKKKKKSLGRDPFEDGKEERTSESVKKLITAKPINQAEARKVKVTVQLTPSSLKHLDGLKAEVARRGREVTRDELIRIAITLLAADDVT